jgi:hypothetical protein
MKSSTNKFEIEEYYENRDNNLKQEIVISSHEKNNNFNAQELFNFQEDGETIEKENLNNSNQSESSERQSFEKDFQIMKKLNELKEENKELRRMNKIQETQIINLSNDYQNSLLKVAELEGKFIPICSNSDQKQIMRLNEEIKKLTTQNTKLNLVIDKLKMEKQEEIQLLKEKYNEVTKISDLAILNEKKHKQEIITKDKKIIKLIEEIENYQSLSLKGEGSNDKIIEDLKNENKQLDKQKNDLLQALKQLMKLISVLKRQKIHLEQSRLLNINEEKFNKLLQEGNIIN